MDGRVVPQPGGRGKRLEIMYRADLPFSRARSKHNVMTSHPCRLCGSTVGETFLDLGVVPLANSLLKPSAKNELEPRHPLTVWVCGDCLLVQLESTVAPEELFSHYVYFSSISKQWLSHCERYVDHVSAKVGLASNSQVIEIGSNDGYLLKLFQ